MYFIASALVGKWETACEECPRAKAALESLSATTKPSKVHHWTSMAFDAAKKRHTDFKVMDIYDVQDSKRE